MTKYKECQECKKAFLIPKSSRIFTQHSCPFCGSWNTAYVNEKIFKQSYNKKLINQG
jgi:hydrogenase maturation factor HypF (carbamoyltransferase family)